MFGSLLIYFLGFGLRKNNMDKVETVGVLLPTRGRPKVLLNSLISLSQTERADLLEVIVVVDDDEISYSFIKENFEFKSKFGKCIIYFSEKRLYPVHGFITALGMCESEIFTWMNDENTYNSLWLLNALDRFHYEFPDGIGLLSLYKQKKAGLGMTTKRFIEANNNEWFHGGYKVYYPDDELTCRAILLGKYAHLKNNGEFHDIEITKEIPVIPTEEKLKQKKIDRGLFYKRSETNFDLDPKKLYAWKGFREINEDLK